MGGYFHIFVFLIFSFSFFPILFLSPKCLISNFNSKGHSLLLLSWWVSSLTWGCWTSSSATSEAATTSSSSSHTSGHSSHEHHHHSHGVVRATHPAKTHSSASASNILSLVSHSQLAALEQGLVEMFGSHSTLDVWKLDVGVTKNWLMIPTKNLPKRLSCLRILLYGYSNDISTVFEMLFQLSVVGLEVDILHPDRALVSIVLSCSLATLGGTISTLVHQVLW